MKKHNVLIDLSIAMNNGYCGIANENRLIFKMLANSDAVDASGLLMSANVATVFSKYKPSASNDELLEQTNRFFHEVFNHEKFLKTRLLTKLKFAKYFFLNKNKFDLFKIDSVFRDTIWRNVFNKSLGASDREPILEKEFAYSNLTTLHTGSASHFKRVLNLNTSGHDFAVFLEPTPVKVSPNTIKVVRYHDAIPITEPDFSGTMHSKRTLNSLQLCASDSYFVCNSEPTRDVLIKLKPELESKAFMIPAAISSNYKRVRDENVLKQIMLTRLSNHIAKPEALPRLRKQIQEMGEFDYIFTLATLDPKKNIGSLVSAWEKFSYQNSGKIKLVIAANTGWFSKDVEKMMLPHIELGNIIHLNNLSVDELPYLLSHAKLFIFPSYTEGFGLPPLEAMQCECPTIVSDIPAHRWVMGDASLFCNPYDVDSITGALTKLLYAEDSEHLRQQLAQKGTAWVKRYSPDVLAGQWSELFEKIKNQNRMSGSL